MGERTPARFGLLSFDIYGAGPYRGIAAHVKSNASNIKGEHAMAEKTGLEAELSVTDHIVKPSLGRAKLEIDVLATLRHHDDSSRVVHVSDSDRIHFWQLLDGDHQPVLHGHPKTEAEQAEGEIHPSFTATIPPEHPLHTTHKVTIDLKRLKPGRSYTFRWVFWDQHSAEQSIHIPAKPPGARRYRR